MVFDLFFLLRDSENDLFIRFESPESVYWVFIAEGTLSFDFLLANLVPLRSENVRDRWQKRSWKRQKYNGERRKRH